MSSVRRYIKTGMLLSILAGLLLPASALAQSQVSDEVGDESEAAERYYQQGTEQYHRGEYEEAVQSFRNAYRALPHPMLSYNLALAKWRSGRIAAAIDIMERALSEGLEGDLVDGARVRVEAWTVAEAVERRALLLAASLGDEVGDEAGDERSLEASAEDIGTNRRAWLGGAIMLVGALGLGGAAVMDYQVGRDGEPLEEGAIMSVDEREQLLSSIERKQQVGLTMLVGGSVMFISGAGLLLWSRSGDEESTARHRSSTVQVGVTPGATGPMLHLRGEWR